MKKHIAFLFIFLLVILTACNMPTANNDTLSLEEQAGTLAAQTLTAVAQLPTIPTIPTETRAPANTPTPPLPTVTPVPTLSPTPVTPTTPPKLPTGPSLKTYNFYCSWNGSNNNLNVTIEWTDKAVDEAGYKLYRNGTEIANLAPNTVAYTDDYAVDSGVNVSYAIEAYNQIGASNRITFSVSCDG